MVEFWIVFGIFASFAAGIYFMYCYNKRGKK